MSESIDHVAEAKKRVRLAQYESLTPVANLRYLEAQVHATLALAEQQRVANLIALGVVGGGPVNDACPVDNRRYLVSKFPDISEVLGIKTGGSDE